MQHLFKTNQCSSATDPRDKVYALIGLSSTPGISEFQIIYSEDQTATSVFQRMAAFLIEEEQYMETLSQVEGRTRLNDLPSWIPNWASNSGVMPLSNYDQENVDKPEYYAGGVTKASLQVLANNILHIQGDTVDEIDKLSNLGWPIDYEMTPAQSSESFFQFFRETRILSQTIAAYPTAEIVESAH
jgi:hypothetical protein